MENLKNFSQTAIAEAIAGALSQLTGDSYAVDITSQEVIDLNLAERNHLSMSKVFGGEKILTGREKIALVLNRYENFEEEKEPLRKAISA